MPVIVLKNIIFLAQESQGTLLSFDKNLLVSMGIQWFNTLLLTAVLYFILYKPVKKFMAERTERIKKEIEVARSEREEAFDEKEKYERLIGETKKERDEILLEAHRKAMEKSDQMLFDARQKAEAMYEDALKEIDEERKNVTDEMKKQIIEISMLVATRYIETYIDREAHDRLIEEAFSNWEGN